MSIRVAESAGFCFGVNRAVELVEQAAGEGKTVRTLGPIIHNRHAVSRFLEMGVEVIDSPEQAQPGQTVIIRSHGVTRAVQEALEARGAQVVDATCPFVKRIHGIVSRAEAEGRLPVIIGTRTHPEVEGIAGWCTDCKIFENAEELAQWANSGKIPLDFPISMVCQTTSTESLWKSCEIFAKKVFTNLKIFDTICKATEFRQSEAANLSKVCQAMVVVGDTHSSNTGRLAMICREHCGRVALVDNALELEPGFFRGVSDVGITAGASTPAWIIKEVNKTMSEIMNVETVQEENFEELLEQSIKTLNTGDKVLGIVTGIGATEVQIDLGTKHAGYIPYDEVSADPTVKPEDVLKVGDEIEVFVVRVNDQEGVCQVSRKKLEGMKVWDEMATWCEEKTTVEGTITEENKGGLVATVKGIRVFIPASQSGIAKGGDMTGMVGQAVQLKITEVNRARRRVIGSIRA
ncbi:MAG: 4-hydroxy-3-methylbut-2-enyl diphosphate reductase, partial [Oscillospiraceae bacterium]|nr:4-hydroxy-3-methylbut-2-enyl diphosphate reductase [Oscillospiraceae bacterium]